LSWHWHMSLTFWKSASSAIRTSPTSMGTDMLTCHLHVFFLSPDSHIRCQHRLDRRRKCVKAHAPCASSTQGRHSHANTGGWGSLAEKKYPDFNFIAMESMALLID
jgi:hypothetical protein